MKTLKPFIAIMCLLLISLIVSCAEPELPTYSENSFMGIEVVSGESLGKLETKNVTVFNPSGMELLFDGNPVPYYENEDTFLLPVDLNSSEWDNGRLTTSDGGKLYIIVIYHSYGTSSELSP